MWEQQIEKTTTPGEQIRAMRKVMAQQIIGVVNNFEKATGVRVDEMHLVRDEDSADAEFRTSINLEN